MVSEEKRAHALLSASSAHIWLHCPPSARMAESMPQVDTPWAAEGTLAHELAECKARKKFCPRPGDGYAEKIREIHADPAYAPEMESCTDLYVQAIDEECMRYSSRPLVVLETRVNYCGTVPEGFGTADCIIIGGDTLTIIDYKHGKGVPISAMDNPQLKLYAIGALNQFNAFYGDAIKHIRLRIVQPRVSDELNDFELTVQDLMQWGNSVVAPVANLAYNGGGECNRGDWCRFCKARAICRQTANNYLALDAFRAFCQNEINALSDDEIGDILTRAAGLQAWVAAVEAYALQASLAGKHIPGHKVVAGRAVRTWTDQDAAFTALQAAGVDQALLYDRKPCALTELEKRLGKAKFKELAGQYVHKPAGKPILAPADDPRPELMGVSVMFGDMNG